MFQRISLIILSAILLFYPIGVLADTDYSIERYSMYVEVQTDGSAEVLEALSYDFDGDYNGILSLFDTDGIDGIENFKVIIDGIEMTQVDEMTYIENTYTVTEVGEDLFEVRVYSPGRNNERLVVYEYTMKNLARRYADTGMIHRKFIGENSSVTLQNAGIAIHFPGNESGIANGSVDIFVHDGMDASKISSDEGFIFIGPENINSGESVELRLLFPADWLSEAAIIDEEMYNAALDEESRIAEEEQLRAVRTENAKYIFTAAYLLIFFSVWALMAKKYGLKNNRRETADSNLISKYPAAFLTAALEDEADTDALTGTLMELVADGSIRMEPEGEGLRFTQVRTDYSGYYLHQAVLSEWLFDERDTFFLSDLNAGDDYERAQQFEAGYSWYISQVSADMLKANLRFKNDALRISMNALIIILGAMGTGGVLLAGKANLLLGIILGGSLFLLVSLMNRIRRLTDEGETLRAAANAFKESGVIPSEGFSRDIPYYAALGMTEPLIHAMEGSSAADDMPVWMYSGWYYSLHTLNTDLRDTHHHNASIPDPNASSSGSSSGNGGGGGHGAW